MTTRSMPVLHGCSRDVSDDLNVVRKSVDEVVARRVLARATPILDVNFQQVGEQFTALRANIASQKAINVGLQSSATR